MEWKFDMRCVCAASMPTQIQNSTQLSRATSETSRTRSKPLGHTRRRRVRNANATINPTPFAPATPHDPSSVAADPDPDPDPEGGGESQSKLVATQCASHPDPMRSNPREPGGSAQQSARVGHVSETPLPIAMSQRSPVS